MIVRGPFTIKWGDNTLVDVEELSIDYELETDDYETVKGKIIELDKGTKVSITLTLLSTDVASLAVVLPQHFVPMGNDLSTGEEVESSAGAIDLIPHKCNETLLYNDLDIVSCANPSQVTRILNARSKLDGIEVSNRLQKFRIKFVGEPETNKAAIQVFKNEQTNTFLLDDGSDFFLNDGNLLIL